MAAPRHLAAALRRVAMALSVALLPAPPPVQAGVPVAIPVRAAGAAPRTIVVIPGDQATQPMIAAVRQLKADPAFATVRFRILAQSLLTPDDLAALAQADVVFARHMVGSVGEQVAPAMQQLAARGGIAYGIGQNEGTIGKLGLHEDMALTAYADGGDAANLANMVRFALRRDFHFAVNAAPPLPLPQSALWDSATGRLYAGFDDYASAYLRHRPAAAAKLPWVAVVINRGQALGGSDDAVKAVAAALEKRGMNVVPLYGYPAPLPIERFLTDAAGNARVAAAVAIGMKIGNVPDKIGPVLEKLGVPFVNAITLYKATRKEWEESPIGLDLAERSWQVAGPELAGITAPTVIASKEKRRDAATGLSYVAEMPVPERVDRLAERVRMLVALRTKPAQDKRVAVIYYNSPPGNANIGASYLNVLPRSLWQILKRLEADGYDAHGRPDTESALFDRLHEHGTNIGSWSPGALAQLASSGNAVLLPVAEYRRWFDRLPAQLHAAMVKAWGEPEDGKIMIWRDARGTANFVFPAQRFGKLLFAPQPARGWGDVKQQYHDTSLPPHHQYLAFYLWLQKTYKADAMVHVGTHATHEWLSGKEVGFTAADPGEVVVGAVPQIYPYIVDVVGEGLQAKRRGMATLISHMTPPFDEAGLNPDLVALRGLLDDYGVAQHKSDSAASATLADINRQGARMGILKDIGKTELRDADDVEIMQHYLEEIGQTQAPMGLHTFGVAPPDKLRRATAQAIVSRQVDLAEHERAARETTLADLIVASAAAELDGLSAALAGRYIAAGPGGDPLRNPASLPTGRNFYGFDPSRLPPPGVYEQGSKLAAAMLDDYKKKNGRYPDRLLFNLWSGETMRHEGVLESEILALLGVRPLWDAFGRVSGVEVIPRAQLGRPRVDITVTPSGLYRDSLPNVMLLLDKAISAVKDLPESDNPIRANVLRTRQALEQRGVSGEQAQRMAAVRLFSEPPGAYGTGLDNVIMDSNTWNAESQVIDVYFKRVGHLFGQGYWGETPQAANGGDLLAIDVFKMALDGVKAVLHSHTSNLYGTLDNDDVLQSVGGAAMAVRQINGATPPTLLVNLADPSHARHESLDQFMGREMRTRYLNPVWIDAMLKEGYAGTRFVGKVVDNLWGWQVTVPEAVDGAKWQQMFETYVQDKHGLDIRERFRKAGNLQAMQAIVDRMLVAVNKGYWKAAPEVVDELNKTNRDLIAQAGVACNRASCSSAEVSAQAENLDRQRASQASAGYGLGTAGTPAARPANSPAPAPNPASAPPAAPQPAVVRGQELRQIERQAQRQQRLERLIWIYAALIAAIIAAGIAYQAWRTRREPAANKTEKSST